MGKIAWLCAVAVSLSGCDSLFGPQVPAPPPTTASFSPTVAFAAGVDCSSGGANPISASWDVRPITLDAGTLGTATEISTQEILQNSAGTTTDCFFTPATGVSAASGNGLRPGLWQITLTHSEAGYPNPVVCTRQLALGGNQIVFVIGGQTVGCQ